MRISHLWLQDFVTFKDNDPQKIATEITAHTAEVEEVEEQGAMLDKCCVGKIISMQKHPNADRLTLCNVKTDQGEKRIVCGGSNLREGMNVALAHIGARVLWHGEDMMTLEPVKIRGEQSEGMICAAEELGLAKLFPDAVGDKVIDLGDSKKGIGDPLKDYLGLKDTVLHIDNHSIAHRSDLFSHVGFARECVAMGIASWKKEPKYSSPKFAKDPLPFKIKNEDKKLVPRYMACLIEIDDIGVTPEFMKARLASADWRSINLPVDITNFVSTEVGMPLHSFDADDIKGDIHMRAAKKGEKIVTLDEIERELPNGALVLSDDKGIFDLLGIMGGLRSSTTSKTRKILLHSAIVDPVNIRKSIIATGHRTEAATIYEKGIPHITAQQGFHRAIELFLAHAPGAKIVSVLDSWGDNGKEGSINLSAEKTRSLLGVDIPTKRIVSILKDLGCSVAEKKDDLTVTVPLHRLGDLAEPHDLIEEVGRIYGFDSIEEVMPSASIVIPDRDFRMQSLRLGLQDLKFIECVPLSLVGPELLKKCNLDPANSARLENPIGEELSLMQPSVLPRLLEHVSENINKVEDVFKTFHIGTVFGKDSDKCTELGMLYTSRKGTSIKDDPFLCIKRDLFTSLKDTGYVCTIRPSKEVTLAAHEGRTADVYVGDNLVGSLFEVKPNIRDNFDIANRVSVAIINIDDLFGIDPVVTVESPLPQFPAVLYDETITASSADVMEDLLKKMQQKSDFLESLYLVDLYSEPDSSEYKATLHFEYRAADRTLTDSDAKKEHSKVMAVV
ncbi:phenylalanine--tRNA ligase subunit beta [Candidatus Peregrinibacteria bacterium]|nr:phenylalanine--tRNA ligase subunit beta [Candidatus Peregrinibacteria bacterium]